VVVVDHYLTDVEVSLDFFKDIIIKTGGKSMKFKAFTFSRL